MPDLEFGALTHRGTVRSLNEDSILAAPPAFVVSDGIGGNEAGEVASAMVVDEFAKLAGRADLQPYHVADTLQAAHQRVRALRAGDSLGAGATAVGAVAIELDGAPRWVVFNIGDSRIYRRTRSGRLVQLSVDHSHVQELVDAGVITADEAKNHPERNLVTRAVGADEGFEPDYWLLAMRPAERLLICSDGLLRETPFEQIEGLLKEPAAANVTASRLLQLSLNCGARDNVSVIVIQVLDRDRSDEDLAQSHWPRQEE